MAWAHTPRPARCFLRSLAGPRCPDADLPGDLDLVTRRLALPRAAPSQGLRLCPPGGRCCPAWPLGRTTPSRGSSAGRHAGLGVLQSQKPSGPPTALLLGPRHCEHFRDRMRTTQRQPAGVSIGRLTGRIDSGCLVSRAQSISLVLAWGQMSRGVIMGFQQLDRRDGGCGAWSASWRCSAGESVSVCPRGGPGCRDHRRGTKWASVGRPPPLPGPPPS